MYSKRIQSMLWLSTRFRFEVYIYINTFHLLIYACGMNDVASCVVLKLKQNIKKQKVTLSHSSNCKRCTFKKLCHCPWTILLSLLLNQVQHCCVRIIAYFIFQQTLCSKSWPISIKYVSVTIIPLSSMNEFWFHSKVLNTHM